MLCKTHHQACYMLDSFSPNDISLDPAQFEPEFAPDLPHLGPLSGYFPVLAQPLQAFGRTHACAPISLWRTIHRLDSANSVLSCKVFFFSPR